MRLRRRGAALPAERPPGPGPSESEEVATPDAVTAPDWHRLAMESMDAIWLRVDAQLRVAEASPRALDMFGDLPLPATLISFARSTDMEAHAREALGGATGPWEVEAASGRRVLQVRGVPLGPHGALLYLDDVTEVRRLEAVRADFVANLAHELRTPVASLSLAAETLSGGLPQDEQQRFVARIAEETTYIEGLLRTVSELAFLEDSVRLQLSEFWLNEVVRESWRRVVDLQGAAELDDTVPPDLRVRADRVRIAEIMQNLFENAHRYSPNGGKVHAGATVDGGSISVWVDDEGPGIPPADLPRIFERFYKVDRARTRRGDGSGLGLAICKHLVSAHGGQIWAQGGPNGGTRVTFTLPEIA